MLISRKGQATTELAIFGTLILVCFAVLLSYAQNMNERQTLQMQAFRKALQKAYDDNGFVSYNILKNPRAVNVFGALAESGRGGASAGASVLWCMGDVESFGYYQINEDVLEIPEGTEIWDLKTESDTTYAATETKTETHSAITTSKQASLSDILTTTLKVEDGDDIVIIQGLGSDGRYRQSAVGETITRGRKWTTPF
jgi:hypothetical protein